MAAVQLLDYALHIRTSVREQCQPHVRRRHNGQLRFQAGQTGPLSIVNFSVHSSARGKSSRSDPTRPPVASPPMPPPAQPASQQPPPERTAQGRPRCSASVILIWPPPPLPCWPANASSVLPPSCVQSHGPHRSESSRLRATMDIRIICVSQSQPANRSSPPFP